MVIVASIDWLQVWIYFLVFYIAVLTPATILYFFVIQPLRRPKPEGYVGRFRRPDDEVVHVARVHGRLMVISEEAPGVMPRALGDVDGRALMRWHRLATSPDGNDRVARPQ